MTSLLGATGRHPCLLIRSFDPAIASPEDWQRYHAYRRLRAREDAPEEPVQSDDEFEHDLHRRQPFVVHRRFIALCDGEIAGNLGVGMRREGTPEYASFAPFVDVWGGVRIASRRQGAARALLRPLLALMQAEDRHTATFRTRDDAGHAFLQAIGAAQKHRAVENRMPFDGIDWDALARWRAPVDAPDSGLRWEVHAGRVPESRLAELMAPFTALINEQPLGALELPRMRYELDGYDSWYAEMDRRGGEHFLVLLLDADGVAAMCDASWDARFPDRIYQQLTAVRHDRRGGGLAKAVKARMLALVCERCPQATMAITFNAEVNAPMLSINHRLGYSVYRQEGLYQIGREALAERVAQRPTSCS